MSSWHLKKKQQQNKSSYDTKEALHGQTRTQSLFTCFRSESGLERAKRAGSDGKRRRKLPSLPARFARSKPLSLRKQVNSDWVRVCCMAIFTPGVVNQLSESGGKQPRTMQVTCRTVSNTFTKNVLSFLLGIMFC